MCTKKTSYKYTRVNCGIQNATAPFSNFPLSYCCPDRQAPLPLSLMDGRSLDYTSPFDLLVL